MSFDTWRALAHVSPPPASREQVATLAWLASRPPFGPPLSLMAHASIDTWLMSALPVRPWDAAHMARVKTATDVTAHVGTPPLAHLARVRAVTDVTARVGTPPLAHLARVRVVTDVTARVGTPPLAHLARVRAVTDVTARVGTPPLAHLARVRVVTDITDVTDVTDAQVTLLDRCTVCTVRGGPRVGRQRDSQTSPP